MIPVHFLKLVTLFNNIWQNLRLVSLSLDIFFWIKKPFISWIIGFGTTIPSNFLILLSLMESRVVLFFFIYLLSEPKNLHISRIFGIETVTLIHFFILVASFDSFWYKLTPFSFSLYIFFSEIKQFTYYASYWIRD